MSGKKILASWMIVLIVTIPFYISSVFGASRLDAQAYGADGIEGFRKETDTVSIVAQAFIQNDDGSYAPVAKNMLKKDNEFFNNDCITDDNRLYACTYTSLLADRAKSAVTYKIRLFDADGSMLSEKDTQIKLDSAAPKVDAFAVSQDSAGLKVSYRITDPMPSSGIAKIDIFEETALINTSTHNGPSSLQQEFSTSSRLKLVGERTFTLVVYDRLGNSGTKPIDVNMDTLPPLIDKGTAKLLYSGRPVSTVKKGAETSLVFSVNVTEVPDAGLRNSLAEVTADLSALVNDKESWKNAKAECSPPAEGVSSCTWQNIPAIAAGAATIIINASDSKGNMAEERLRITLNEESTAPAANAGTFKLMRNGAEVHAVKAGTATVDASVEIFEENPGLANSGVFLELGGKSLQASACGENATTHVWRCTWNSISLDQGASFSVSAEDLWGNKAVSAISYPLAVDDSPPVVSYVGTEHRAPLGLTYASVAASNANRAQAFIAEIEEEGSGLAKQNVRLTVGSAQNIEADACTNSGSLWTCFWNVTVSGAGAVNALVTALDNAEHFATKTSAVFIDTITPVLKSLTVSSTSSSGEVLYHETGYPMNIIAEVEDDSPVALSADLSRLGTSADSSGCIYKGAKSWQCILKSFPVQKPGYAKVAFSIEVTDAAGNRAVPAIASLAQQGFLVEDGKLFAEVLHSDVIVEPNFWRFERTSSSPSALDRQTIEIIGQAAYFPIKLVPVVSGATLMSVDFVRGSCANVPDGPKSIERLDIEGVSFTGGVPYFTVNAKPGRLDDDALHFTCQFELISRLGNDIYTKPEIENITFSIGAFNSPLGEIGAALNHKIDKSKKGWIGPDSALGKTLGVLTKVMAIAKGICTILGVIDKIRKIMGAIVVALGATEFFLVTKPVDVTACVTQGTISTGQELIWPVTNNFCKFLSCDYTVWDMAGAEASSFVDLGIGEKGWLTSGSGTSDSVVAGVNVHDVWTYGLDPMKSLPAAVAKACLPGIVSGLEKWRQVECQYVVCLQKYVKQGMPASACSSARSYQLCKNIFGELFQLTPLAVLNDIMNFIKQALSDPFVAAGVVMAAVCHKFCTKGSTTVAVICDTFRWLSLSGDLANDLKTIFSKKAGGGLGAQFKPVNDMCSEVV